MGGTLSSIDHRSGKMKRMMKIAFTVGHYPDHAANMQRYAMNAGSIGEVQHTSSKVRGFGRPFWSRSAAMARQQTSSAPHDRLR